MRLVRLLLLGAGVAYVYKRFVADSGAGLAETQAAEPFSSEQLGDPPAQESSLAPEASGAEGQNDTLEQPTWLDAADAPEGAAS